MEKITGTGIAPLYYERLVDVLAKGEVEARQLKAHLNEQQPSFEFCKASLESIHFALNEAMSIAKVSMPENCLPSVWLNSSSSLDSPSSDSSDHKDMPKKRKSQPKWSNKVRVNPGTMDAPLDDGHSWRKYGQKDILGAKYPRAYYRCTHRITQGCLATKQVQRSDSDPSIFDVIYRGEHSCSKKIKQKAASSSSQENKQDFFSFNTGVKIEGNEHERSSSSVCFPSSQVLTCLSSMDNHFMGNDCFSVSPCIDNHQQANESELNDIFFTSMTSASNSSVVGIHDFMDYNPFDPKFFH
ncbi:probable WRKY transcription factor 46 [Dioscorea cayenensis subsp. rotundata]|uniref:Probable WRKY transcription factor 46 n=1 Tax=Dioscorea cayennensis subsp. rotundata TaxID=55577 RepID=A0AB40CUA4_DIOCR|nr:probable WRKY transcription factor 46 [Dioscorea cayenensis subsp. rotundata]